MRSLFFPLPLRIVISTIIALPLLIHFSTAPLNASSSQFVWDIPSDHIDQKLVQIKRFSALNVLFWNIRNGELAQLEASNDQESHPLDENLRSFTRLTNYPDIMILGECSAKALHAKTRAHLDHFYGVDQNPSHYEFIPYNERSPNFGLCIWSAKRAKPITSPTQLSWLPKSSSSQDLEAYKRYWSQYNPVDTIGTTTIRSNDAWGRPFVHLTFTRGKKTLHVFPLHLLQPWIALEHNSKLEGKFAKLAVVKNLVWGENVPIIHQINSFTQKLSEEFHGDLQNHKLVVLGDLNLPPFSHGYRLFNAYLNDAFSLSNLITTTFPARSSPETTSPLKLDHAFVSQGTKARFAEVLPLMGSDHYAIYVQLEL